MWRYEMNDLSVCELTGTYWCDRVEAVVVVSELCRPSGDSDRRARQGGAPSATTRVSSLPLPRRAWGHSMTDLADACAGVAKTIGGFPGDWSPTDRGMKTAARVLSVWTPSSARAAVAYPAVNGL
jgi:hypothetical protein